MIGTSLGFSTGEQYNGSILIVPPKKISQSYYRCDSKFHLDEILEMYEEEEKYGIVLVSGEICRIYQITKSGTYAQIKEIKSSQVHQLKGHKKGGQSAPRFQRLRDENEDAQIKKVVEHMVTAYWNHENATVTVDGILIGGPAEFKNKVREHPLVKQFFDKVIVDTVTTSSIDDGTVNQVYEKYSDLFVSQQMRETITLINQFQKRMEFGDDKLIYGFDEAVQNLDACLLEKLVVSDDISNEKKELLKLTNSYSCPIIWVDKELISKIGVDIIGVRFY